MRGFPLLGFVTNPSITPITFPTSSIALCPFPTVAHHHPIDPPTNTPLVDVRAVASRCELDLAGSLQGAQKESTVSQLLHGAKHDGVGR